MNTPDHPDFTALALGEHIHGMPARAVIDALRTSVAARQEAEQIRVTAASLALVLKGQPPQRLDNKRRSEIFHADTSAVRARFAAEELAEAADIEFTPPPAVRRPRRAWLTPALAAAAVVTAAVLVLKLLPGREPAGPHATPLLAGEQDPAGRIMVTPVAPDKARPRAPGAQILPEVVMQNTAVPPQETPAAPPVEIPAEVVQQPPPAEPAPAMQPVPAKPPWRPNPKDYAAPPRVK